MAESVFVRGMLDGKVAVVTGGGSGINLRVAERFAEHGAKVVLVGRTQEKLDSAAEGIAASGGEAVGFAADVRDQEALEDAFDRVRGRYGELDVLLCGAAGNFPARAEELSAGGFKAVVDIDLLGTFNACRAAFPHLRKPGASVVSISAVQSLIPTPMQAHVSAAKAGIDMLTRVLAAEWGPYGVRLNTVAPGPVGDTEGMRRLTLTEETRKRLEESIPLGRYATSDEIANAVLFLCSGAASYVTGAVLACDGGQSLLGSSGWAEVLDEALGKD